MRLGQRLTLLGVQLRRIHALQLGARFIDLAGVDQVQTLDQQLSSSRLFVLAVARVPHQHSCKTHDDSQRQNLCASVQISSPKGWYLVRVVASGMEPVA